MRSTRSGEKSASGVAGVLAASGGMRGRVVLDLEVMRATRNGRNRRFGEWEQHGAALGPEHGQVMGWEQAAGVKRRQLQRQAVRQRVAVQAG